jgi:hypothetical protein
MVEGTGSPEDFKKNCQKFGKSSPKSSQDSIYIKTHFESQKHLCKTGFETFKYLQETLI